MITVCIQLNDDKILEFVENCQKLRKDPKKYGAEWQKALNENDTEILNKVYASSEVSELLGDKLEHLYVRGGRVEEK